MKVVVNGDELSLRFPLHEFTRYVGVWLRLNVLSQVNLVLEQVAGFATIVGNGTFKSSLLGEDGTFKSSLWGQK